MAQKEKTGSGKVIKEKEITYKEDKSVKTSNLIVYLLIAIVVISVLAFIFLPKLRSANEFVYTSPSGEKFNFVTSRVGVTPIYTLKLFVTYGDKLNKQYEIPLRNRPYDLEDIEVDKGIRTKILTSKGIFITLDPELDQKAVIAGIQLSKVLGTANYGVFKIPTQGAFTLPINTTNQSDYPVKTCRDATQDIRVISLQIGNETRAYLNKDCIIVEGKNTEELIKASEKTVLKLLNVM